MCRFMFALLLVLFATSGIHAANCGGPVPCRCGDTVTRNYVLPTDLGPCKGHGLHVANGVVLDGNGHRLVGPAGNSEVYGVYLNGTRGGTVKNVTVTGFRHGIRLRGATNNQIRNNETFRNGDFSKRVGYGIDVAKGARDNFFEGNLIYDNADEGIHFGSGSGANTFTANRIYNNFRENIYIFASHNNTLLNNTTWGGQNSLFVKDSSFTLIAGNTFRNAPAVIRANSHDNQLVENDFIGAGLLFQVYTKETPLRFPRDNTMLGGKVSNAGTCMRFSSSWGNVIVNTVLTACGTDIASTGDHAQSRNTFISSSFRPNKIQLDVNSVIEVGWFLDITVRDNIAQPLSGARVRAFDATNTLLFDVFTERDGTIDTQPMLESSYTGARKTFHTPIVVETTKPGYTPDRRQLSLTGNTAVVVTLR